ncbi:MAG: nucleotidyltransferase family protein [Synechocystis sp.]
MKPKPNIIGKMPMSSLCQTLIRVTLTPPNPNLIANVEQQLDSATPTEWKNTLETLAIHRIIPLVFYTVKTLKLIDSVPINCLGAMQAKYNQTRRENAYRRLMLVSLLRRMEAADLHPIIWKGMVMAEYFYPDPGTRPMSDIDFAIPGDELEQTTAVFKSLGFLPQLEAETSDAVYFANQMGVLCDVHHRVRLFEGKESMNLTTELKPERMSVPFTVLEPNAMLVHLIVHMDGHRAETGLLLSWILDIAFVLRKWGALLDLEQIQKLMPAQEHSTSLFRTIGFLEKEFGQKIPACLAEAAKSVKPYSLQEILRQRRLALWGLPYPRGWLRLGASKLGIPLRYSHPSLQVNDLFLWLTDLVS